MVCRIAELRNKQVVCIKNGCVLGFISDVNINSDDGCIEAIIIYGRLRLFGLFGREDDIIIPWRDIAVIGQETVLVETDPAPFISNLKRGKNFF